jgi:outer membrane protein OmpA-like peptidoglycan-associated protein
MNIPIRAIAVAALATFIAACSTVPERNSALEQARSRHAAAQNDPQVARLASDELKRAGEALRMADLAHTDGDDVDRVDHLAYLALQRVTLAQAAAANRASQAVTAGAAAERDRLRLTMRTDEADRARRQLEVARQGSERQSSQLAAADATATRERARAAELEARLQALDARKTERGMVLTLGDVLFDTGEARLLPAADGNMRKLAEFFRQYPQQQASIEGHTDDVGAADFNQTLSGQRADAVRGALMNLGVPADRLSTRAHGESAPTASNTSAAGRQMNRRVEIVFVTMAGEGSMPR